MDDAGGNWRDGPRKTAEKQSTNIPATRAVMERAKVAVTNGAATVSHHEMTQPGDTLARVTFDSGSFTDFHFHDHGQALGNIAHTDRTRTSVRYEPGNRLGDARHDMQALLAPPPAAAVAMPAIPVPQPSQHQDRPPEAEQKPRPGFNGTPPSAGAWRPGSRKTP